MTTLLHLNQALVDIQENLTREQRFSQDACHSLLNGTKLVREAVEALERDIRTHFDERDRSVSRLLGNSQPYTTLIDEASSPAVISADGEAQRGVRGKKLEAKQEPATA